MLLLDNTAVVTGAGVKVPAGRYAFALWGTSIGAATVILERSMPDNSWLSVGEDAELAAFGQIGVDLPGGVYRARVTDGGADPSGLYASLEPLQ